MKKRLTLAIICIISAVFTVSAVSFAWFKNYQMNKVYANELQVDSETNFLISTSEDGSYGTALVYSFGNLVMRNITGDGITFLKPATNSVYAYSEHGVDYSSLYSAVPDTSEEWSAAVSTNGDSTLNETADYISIDVYFKSSVNGDVYLGANSQIKPKSTILVSDDEDTDKKIENKSAYGDFSRDLIAGAVRVSFIDMSDESNPSRKLVWVPNSEYELSYNATSGWTFNKDGTSEDEVLTDDGYYYYKQDKTKWYFQTSEYVKTIPDSGKKIIELTESTTEPGVYIGHIKINIWVEGCDREARRALAGGILSMKLDFTIAENTTT